MGNKLAKFDVTQHIRDRVRAVLLEALPEEALDQAIQAEWSRFFVSTKDRYGSEHASPFSDMVQSLLAERVRAKVIGWLDANFEQEWDGRTQKLVGPLVAELVPIVQERMHVELVSQALNDLRGRLVG